MRMIELNRNLKFVFCLRKSLTLCRNLTQLDNLGFSRACSMIGRGDMLYNASLYNDTIQSGAR